MDLIAQLEQEEISRLGKTIPDFAPGDTVSVAVNVVEGTRKRAQVYEGVVIARRNRGLNSAFIVRKISSGEGVERTFQIYSPLFAGIVSDSLKPGYGDDSLRWALMALMPFAAAAGLAQFRMTRYLEKDFAE